MIRKSHGVALAALALAASGAFAQSSVKIYGLLDVSFGSIEPAHVKVGGQKLDVNGNAISSTSVNSGQMTTSFIGFSGSEDLGGGLKAEFALESFLAVDDGNNIGNNGGAFWSRASWVGLSGGFGKVIIGQYDNPLFTFGYTYNPFGSSMAFSPTMRQYNYIGQNGLGLPTGVGFDTGWINSLTYESPNLSGFTFVGQYAFKETSISQSKNSYTLAGNYNAGPLSLGLVYAKAGASNNLVGSWFADQNVFALGGSYDFGVVKPFVQFTTIKTKKLLTGPTTISDLGDNDAKSRIFQIGASIPVTTAGTILASYGQSKVELDNIDGSVKDTVLSLGYDHTLSKRTDVYAVYMYNKKSVPDALSSFLYGATDWKKGNSFAVGIRHNF